MRRSEREISEKPAIDVILENAEVCRLAFAVENEPYLVPVSYGYDANAACLYFHSGKQGKKIDCIEANNRVCFEVEGKVELVTHETTACKWSYAYESVIGYGVISEVCELHDKKRALNVIMEHYSRDTWDMPDAAVQHTRVWKLRVESVTGKSSHSKDDESRMVYS